MTGGVGGGKLSWLRLEVGESLLVRNWRAAREDTSEWLEKIMAAAQVAKKLKDKRQRRTIEGIFNKVDMKQSSEAQPLFAQTYQ